MKLLGVYILLLLLGAAVLLFGPSAPDVESLPDDDHMAISATDGKLKGDNYLTSHSERTDHMDLEDYHPVDPAPSSKAKVKPGPIEHGTPLNPYIPRAPPPPPSHPSIGG